MTAFPDDLTGLKDDMVAFVAGHGMQRFPGAVEIELVPSMFWKSGGDPESWKDFVELAKSTGAAFVTMDFWRLQREEYDELLESLSNAEFADGEDLDEARWLRTYFGKTGFVQIAFAHQGVMMVWEASTEWYERYQRLLELFEDFGGISMDERNQDNEI